MKGWITGGIVYPAAIYEISKRFNPLPAASRESVKTLLARTATLGRDLAAEDALDVDLPNPPPALAIRATLDA